MIASERRYWWRILKFVGIQGWVFVSDSRGSVVLGLGSGREGTWAGSIIHVRSCRLTIGVQSAQVHISQME